MILKNAKIVSTDGILQGDLRMEHGRITGIGRGLTGAEVRDCGGQYLLPGLVDTHMHGAAGLDCYTLDKGNVAHFTRYEAYHGVTSVAATLRTAPKKDMLECSEKLWSLSSLPQEGARIRAIHPEGPFLAPAKMGATDPDSIALPDIGYFDELLAASHGLMKIMAIAPELDGAMEVIRHGSERGVIMALGHTDADLETARRAIACGAARATHTFNAMRPLKHREPGVLGAVLLEEKVQCEVICDFVHLHPQTVELIYRLKGAGGICVISDSISACGYPEGYSFMDIDNRPRYVSGGVLHLEDGTIAGGATPMGNALGHLRSLGIPFPEIVRMTSYQPAKSIGILADTGTLEVGKAADVLLVSEDGTLLDTWAGGVLAQREDA